MFDWLERLYQTKSLFPEQKKEILPFLPKEIFAELDKISPVKLSDKKYQELKKTLVREVSELINYLINIGNLKLTDFDLLQFNLSQRRLTTQSRSLVHHAVVENQSLGKGLRIVEKCVDDAKSVDRRARLDRRRG